MLSRKQVIDKVLNASLWVFVAQLGLLVGIEAVYIAVFAADEEFNTAYDNPSLTLIGWATSAYPLWAAIGAFSTLYFVHAIREVFILGVSVYLWLVGYLVGSLVSGSMAALVASRVIKGLAIGLMTSVLPLYIEKAVESKRDAARLLTLFQASVPLGILFMAIISQLSTADHFAKKWMHAAAPAFPVALTVFVFPQRCQTDRITRENQAKQQRKQQLKMSQLQQLQHQHQHQLVTPDKLSAGTKLVAELNRLVQSRSALIRCEAASLAQAAGPITAINVVFYYSSAMCKMLGFEDGAADFMSLGIYACNFVGTAFSLFIINRLPRKPTLQYSLLAMAIVHGALFMMQQLQPRFPNEGVIGIISIALIFAFVLVYSLLFAGISLVYTSEVVSPGARGVSIGIATSCGWLCNFVIAIGSAFVMPLMGGYIFLLFTYLCCTFYAVFGVVPSPVHTKLEETLVEG